MIKYIERPIYIEKVKPFIGKSVIKVLVGQRRVGKSFLLMQISNLIKHKNPETQIIYINKELKEFSDIKNANDLFSYIQRNENPLARSVAMLIDEVHEIDFFEVVLRDLITRGKYDIYCTGSNAKLLSGELATFLGGRYVEIKVYGLSYAEYLEFNGIQDSSESFNLYLRFGGLPYLRNLSNELHVVYEYLTNIYNSIILKDVVARFNVRNVRFLVNLVEYLSDNIGNIVSSKRISEYLKSQRINISPQVVIDYITYLESSFLLSKVKRIGIEGKKVFEVGEKYYFEDVGIRNAIVGFKATDIHKLLENIVYHHLKIAGYTVWVGVQGKKEIDFIGQKEGEKIYVQVAYLLTDSETINREFGNLLEISDNFPKYVVTMDEITETSSYKGVIRMHVKDFCLMMTKK